MEDSSVSWVERERERRKIQGKRVSHEVYNLQGHVNNAIKYLDVGPPAQLPAPLRYGH